MAANKTKEEPESKDLLADLQDISDSERKTSTAESSIGNERTKLYIDMAHRIKDHWNI